MPNIACQGALFGAACSVVKVVPVPFKHGIDSFLTLDDLLVDMWMDSMFITTSAGTWKSSLLLETVAYWTDAGDDSSAQQLAVFGIRDAGSDRVSTYTNEPLTALLLPHAEHWECNWPGSFIVLKLGAEGQLLDVTGPDLEDIQDAMVL